MRIVDRGMAVLGAEMDHEAGEVVPSMSPDGKAWLNSYQKAQADHRLLIDQTHLEKELSREDIPLLREALASGRSASEEIREITALLASEPQSDLDAKRIIRQAANRLATLRAELSRRSSHSAFRLPLAESQPPLVKVLCVSADHEIRSLHEKVGELKRRAGWISPDQPIGVDLEGSPAIRGDLVALCTEACHLSRVAYVLLYMVADSHGVSNLREDFLKPQREAQLITAALARHPSLRSPSSSVLREALESYAASMGRRISSLVTGRIEASPADNVSAP